MEAGIETDVVGNLFVDPSQGLRFRFRAFNDSKHAKASRGRLRVTDFWDRTVWEEKPDLEVPPGQSAQRHYAVLRGRRGFFRIHWEPENGPAQNLRCAVIEPSDEPSLGAFVFGTDFGEMHDTLEKATDDLDFQEALIEYVASLNDAHDLIAFPTTFSVSRRA